MLTMTKENEGQEEFGEPGDEKYILRLFVTGATPNSVRAITNLKKICDTYLKGRYELEIIDIFQQPLPAKEEQVIAVPLLIKKFPLPERKLVGDMSNKEKVLKGLGIHI